MLQSTVSWQYGMAPPLERNSAAALAPRLRHSPPNNRAFFPARRRILQAFARRYCPPLTNVATRRDLRRRYAPILTSAIDVVAGRMTSVASKNCVSGP